MTNVYFSPKIFKKITKASQIRPGKTHLKHLFHYIKANPKKGYSLWRMALPLDQINKSDKRRYRVWRVYQIRRGDKFAFTSNGTTFGGYLNILTSPFTVYKNITNAMMNDLGLPTSNWRVFYSLAALKKKYAGCKFHQRLVAKPIDGSRGVNITLNISSMKELIRAAALVLKSSPGVQIEHMHRIENDYRVHLIGSKVTACVSRIKASIIGDGKHSITALTAARNRAGKNKPVSIDAQSRQILAEQGYSARSIPAKGEHVFLKHVTNFSQGGDLLDLTKRIHPSIAAQCEKFSRAIRQPIMGLDIITSDISEPLAKTGGFFLEANSAPHWDLVHKVVGDRVIRELLDYVISTVR